MFHLNAALLPCRRPLKLPVRSSRVLKNLPVNTRATALARSCGYDDVKLHGQIYIGRLESGKASHWRDIKSFLSHQRIIALGNPY